jgi:hypothetical protein
MDVEPEVPLAYLAPCRECNTLVVVTDEHLEPQLLRCDACRSKSVAAHSRDAPLAIIIVFPGS